MFKRNRLDIGLTLSVLVMCYAFSLAAKSAVAQQNQAQQNQTQQYSAQQGVAGERVVPSLVKYAGTLCGIDGKPLTGTQGLTFLLYKEESGGAPLWMETQNVQADKNGRYSVMLGAANGVGLPTDVFMTGEARWLAVQVSGQAEQARTLLMSVPYALKAADAETLGGKPASAFMAAASAGSGRGGPLAQQAANDIVCASSTACKTAFVPVFASNGGAASVTDSILTQSGTTLKIAGSEAASGTISAGTLTASGNVNAANVNVVGNVSSSAITTTNTFGGIYSTMTGAGNGVGAIQGVATATGSSGFTFGVIGQSASDLGRGVFGSTTGAQSVGVIGETTGSSGIGVVGKTLNGEGLAFAATGNVQQDRTSGGWAKAMLFVNTAQAPYTILRCFNSSLVGTAATTPPCGFNLTEIGVGVFTIDMGFEVDDRFVNGTVYNDMAVPVIYASGTTFQIFCYNMLTQKLASGEYYWLTVY
jgi:hypothetical protein